MYVSRDRQCQGLYFYRFKTVIASIALFIYLFTKERSQNLAYSQIRPRHQMLKSTMST